MDEKSQMFLSTLFNIKTPKQGVAISSIFQGTEVITFSATMSLHSEISKCLPVANFG